MGTHSVSQPWESYETSCPMRTRKDMLRTDDRESIGGYNFDPGKPGGA